MSLTPLQTTAPFTALSCEDRTAPGRTGRRVRASPGPTAWAKVPPKRSNSETLNPTAILGGMMMGLYQEFRPMQRKRTSICNIYNI